MTGEQLRLGRKKAAMSQEQAAARLGISQPYLSQLECGRRRVSPEVARAAVRLFKLPPTALPTPHEVRRRVLGTDRFVRALAALGYPGCGHVRAARSVNPAALVLDALGQENLDARVTAALPWVLLRYPGLDWGWLLKHAKLGDLQNRLGFLVALGRELATRQPRRGRRASRPSSGSWSEHGWLRRRPCAARRCRLLSGCGCVRIAPSWRRTGTC